MQLKSGVGAVYEQKEADLQPSREKVSTVS